MRIRGSKKVQDDGTDISTSNFTKRYGTMAKIKQLKEHMTEANKFEKLLDERVPVSL
jgi:hypothetical protein